MMTQIKSVRDLSDSRLMFDNKIPSFGYMIVIIIILVFIGATIWSIFTPKIYMIKANGSITSSYSNYVMASYSGEIEECNISEGKIVNEGDVLFKLKSTDYNLQEEQLLKNKIMYEEQIEKYELLVKSIKDNKNYFSVNSKDDELYYSTYETYKAQIAQNELDSSEYIQFGYTNEQIEGEIKKNQGKISEIYYYSIQTAENAIKEARTQIGFIEAQLSAINSGQEDYLIRANSSGVLHLLDNYKVGMVIQATATIATIIPQNSDTIIEAYVSTTDMARIRQGDNVEIVVDGLSQSIYGTVKGTILQIDSNAVSIQNSQGETKPAFKVKILPEVNYVVSKTGDKINFSNGMTVEARIEYDKITYFNYLLEKLGIRAR